MRRPLAAQCVSAAQCAGALALVPLLALLLEACGAAGTQAGQTAAPAAPAAAPTTPGDAPLADLRLGGAHRDYGHDPDGNGLFEQLVVAVALDVTRAGRVVISTQLTDAQGRPLGWGSLAPQLDRAAPLLSADLPAGQQEVPVYFSGAPLRAADGPYTAHIRLIGAGRATLDEASHTTAPYRRALFQGLIAQLRGLRDRGVARGEGGYSALRVDIDLELLAAGTVTLQAQLFAGEQFLAHAGEAAQLPSGPHTVVLDFAGDDLAEAGRDGPYTLYLTLADAHYTENHTYTTQMYAASSFQPGAAGP